MTPRLLVGGALVLAATIGVEVVPRMRDRARDLPAVPDAVASAPTDTTGVARGGGRHPAD